MIPEVRQGYDPGWLDAAVDLYRRAGLGSKDPEALDLAFRHSAAVVSCWDAGELVGLGRMISDGAFYAAIFDVAVAPERQGQGIGRAVMDALHDAAGECRVYLTSTFGNEGFYAKLGYRRHKTAMARYPGKLADSPYLVGEDDAP